MTVSTPARRRGRPPVDPARQDAARQQILDAAGRVYAVTGFHGLTLDRVAAEAGLSRPTLYKHFPDAAAITEALVQSVNDRLIAAMITAATASDDPFARLGAALLAWRAWGETPDIARLLPMLFAELHNPQSPAFRHRQRTLGVFSDLVQRQVTLSGRPAPSPLAVDTLLQGVEFVGYRFLLDPVRDDARWQDTLNVMLRLALGLIGTAADRDSADAWSDRFRLAATPASAGESA